MTGSIIDRSKGAQATGQIGGDWTSGLPGINPLPNAVPVTPPVAPVGTPRGTPIAAPIAPVPIPASAYQSDATQWLGGAAMEVGGGGSLGEGDADPGERPWWDIPQHLAAGVENVMESSAVDWIEEHGGERVGNWWSEFGGNSSTGLTLAIATAPIRLPVWAYTQGLEVLGDMMTAAQESTSFLAQAMTYDNPLYRDGISLDDFGTMFEFAQTNMSPGQAIGMQFGQFGRIAQRIQGSDVMSPENGMAADYTKWAPIFDVGFNPYAMTAEERADLNANAVYGVGTGAMDLGFQVGVAVVGDKGITSVARGAGVATSIRGVRDLRKLDEEIVAHTTGQRETVAGRMVDQLRDTSDINVIMHSPLVNLRSPKSANVVQMLARVNTSEDVRLILMADRGDRRAIARLMNDAPDYIFEMSDVAPMLQKRLLDAAPEITARGSSTERFLESAFSSRLERDSFYRQARDAFLNADPNDLAGKWVATTRNNTRMPLGSSGGRILGKPGDVLGEMSLRGSQTRARIARGEGVLGDFVDSDNWSMRTLGKIGTSTPTTKILQWGGGRKPIGLVGLSSSRPNEVMEEMSAWVDEAVWTTGKVSFSFRRGGQTVTMTGPQYRAEMGARISEAVAAGPSTVATTVRQIEEEMLSSIALNRKVDSVKVDEIVRAIQSKRDMDVSQIQNKGYFYDADVSQVLVDPVYQRQLADSIHLVPLRIIDREFGSHFENGVYMVDRGYEAVQRLWRTAVLFKPAYTLKNAVAEPLVASIMAHGSIFSPDGLYTTVTNFTGNMRNRVSQVSVAGMDRANSVLGHVPGVRAAVANSYAVRAKRMGELAQERAMIRAELESWDAEVDSIGTGVKSPAWEAKFGASVRESQALAAKRLREIEDELDTMTLLDDMPSHRDIYEQPTYGELRRKHETIATALREEPTTAAARIAAQADVIENAATKRSTAVADAENARLAQTRQSIINTAENVRSVQARRITAYATQVEETLAKRKARLARLEEAETGRLKGIDQGSYTGGTKRLREQWPVVAPPEKTLVGQARIEVEALEDHLNATLAQLQRLIDDPSYAGTPAQKEWLASLADEPVASHTVRSEPTYLPGEAEEIARLRAQAAAIAAMTPEQRAAYSARLDEAGAEIEKVRDALNTSGLDAYPSRTAAEDALDKIEEEFTDLQVKTASQVQDRVKHRMRVLGGTKPVVFERDEYGSLTRMRYGKRREGDRVGAQWKANEEARLQGRLDDITPIDERFVVMPGLFDPNHYGDAARADFGATMTNRSTFDPGRTYSDVVSQKLVRGGGTTEIPSTDPMYFEELAYVANRQVRMDPIAVKVMSGANAADLRDWLDTPAGRTYAEKMGWTPDNARTQVSDAVRLLEQYYPRDALIPDELLTKMRKEGHNLPDDANLHDVLAVRDVTPSELQAVLAHRGPERLSPVHSGELVFQDSRPFRRGQDAIWRTLATRPEERIGRFPGGQRYYEEHLKRDIEFLQAQNPNVKLTPAEINALRSNAATRALQDVEKTYYNIRRYSHPVYAMRYLTAFPGALYNSMYRMSRLAGRSPGKAIFMANAFTNGFQQVGVDENGEKTEDFRKVRTIVLDVPLYMKDNIKGTVELNIQSLDFVRPSPSFAWTVAVPVDTYLATKPDAALWMKENLSEGFIESLWPFGDPTSKAEYGISLPGGARLALDSMVPSHFRDFLTMTRGPEGDRRYIQTVNQYWQAMAYEWEEGGKVGKAPSIEDAQEAASKHWKMQFAAKFAVYGGLSIKPAGDLERTAWQKISEEYGDDYDGALAEYLKMFGPNADVFTVSTTKRAGGVPPTVDGWRRMFDSEDLVGDIMAISPEDPSVLKPLFGDDSGSFDQAVYNAQTHTQIPGTDITVGEIASSQEWIASVEASSSWDEYMAAKAIRDAEMVRYGYGSLQSKESAWLKDSWNAWFTDFASKPENRAWVTEYQNRDFGRATRTIKALELITSNEALMTKERDNPYFQAMSLYMNDYQEAADYFAQAEDADQRTFIVESWQQHVRSTILPLNQQFAKLYDRYLDENDLRQVM